MKQIRTKEDFKNYLQAHMNEDVETILDGATDFILYNEMLDKDQLCDTYKDSGSCYDNRMFAELMDNFDEFFTNTDPSRIAMEVYMGTKDGSFNPNDDWFYLDDSDHYHSFNQEYWDEIYEDIYCELYSDGLTLDDYNLRNFLNYDATELINLIESNCGQNYNVSFIYEELIEIVNRIEVLEEMGE